MQKKFYCRRMQIFFYVLLKVNWVFVEEMSLKQWDFFFLSTFQKRLCMTTTVFYLRETSVTDIARCLPKRLTLTVLLNSIDSIGWGPAIAFADWLGSKVWWGYVVQLATLYLQALHLTQKWLVRGKAPMLRFSWFWKESWKYAGEKCSLRN